MIIDATEIFADIRRDVCLDRELVKEYKEKYNIVLIELPDGDADIIIDGRMIAFIPEED